MTEEDGDMPAEYLMHEAPFDGADTVPAVTRNHDNFFSASGG